MVMGKVLAFIFCAIISMFLGMTTGASWEFQDEGKGCSLARQADTYAREAHTHTHTVTERRYGRLGGIIFIITLHQQQISYHSFKTTDT